MKIALQWKENGDGQKDFGNEQKENGTFPHPMKKLDFIWARKILFSFDVYFTFQFP